MCTFKRKISMSLLKKIMSVAEPATPAVEPSNLSLEESLVNSLVNLNCHYEKRTREDGFVAYDFKYQGRVFSAQLNNNGARLTICYPYLYVESLDSLNMVRHMCNVFNGACFHHKLYYSIDDKDYRVAVHCDMPVLKVLAPDDLVERIDSIFQVQHDFTLQTDKEIADNKGGHFRDFEYQQALDAHETIMAHELEISHQSADVSVRSNEDFSFTIHDFMSLACDDTQVEKYVKLRIIDGEEITVYDDDATIRVLPLYQGLIEVVEPDSEFETRVVKFAAQDIVMIVDYLDGSDVQHSLTINLVARDEDDSTLYYRAYAVPQPSDLDRSQSSRTKNEQKNQPQVVSLLLACDKCDVTRKLQEFDYMWKDAQDKLTEKDPSLNDDDIIFAQLANGHVGLNFYWGRRCLANGYFAQALKHFFNAYNVLRYESTTTVSDALSQVSYYIGLCLCEMGKYDRAFFYLDINRNSGKIDQLIELINAVANVGDMRAFFFIDNYLRTVEENFGEEAELPGQIARFVSFLRRRHAFCLINFGKLDEAEKEFKALLNDPESNDYALGELAYIQQLRASEEASKNVEPSKE